MKKFKTIFYIIFLASFVYSCQTMKKGFESQRKNSTDEFFVEKKQPLVMPPDFEKLPIPKQIQSNSDKESTNQVKKIIATDSNSNLKSKSSTNLNQKTENFILDKIKD